MIPIIPYVSIYLTLSISTPTLLILFRFSMIKIFSLICMFCVKVKFRNKNPI